MVKGEHLRRPPAQGRMMSFVNMDALLAQRRRNQGRRRSQPKSRIVDGYEPKR